MKKKDLIQDLALRLEDSENRRVQAEFAQVKLKYRLGLALDAADHARRERGLLADKVCRQRQMIRKMKEAINLAVSLGFEFKSKEKKNAKVSNERSSIVGGERKSLAEPAGAGSVPHS